MVHLSILNLWSGSDSLFIIILIFFLPQAFSSFGILDGDARNHLGSIYNLQTADHKRKNELFQIHDTSHVAQQVLPFVLTRYNETKATF